MDWTGNSKSIYSTLGASNHSVSKRADNDYYATHPLATELLMQTVLFADNIWEPCCGGGHMAKVLESHGYTVKATDLYDRGYGQGGVDFLKCFEIWEGDIITNPPYKMAREIAEHALELVTDGHKVAMFLKTTFLEGQARRSFFEKYPPHHGFGKFCKACLCP
jgi:hypothetical protein